MADTMQLGLLQGLRFARQAQCFATPLVDSATVSPLDAVIRMETTSIYSTFGLTGLRISRQHCQLHLFSIRLCVSKDACVLELMRFSSHMQMIRAIRIDSADANKIHEKYPNDKNLLTMYSSGFWNSNNPDTIDFGTISCPYNF